MLAAAVMALGSIAPSGTGAGGQSAAAAESRSASSSRLVDFDSVGPVTTRQTITRIATILHAPPTESGGDPECLRTAFDASRKSGELGALAASITVLASSGGAAGPVDVITLSGGSSAAARSTAPRTVKGIRVGDTLAELEKAYGARLTVGPPLYLEKGKRASLKGPRGTGMRFDVTTRGRISAITIGRTPQIDYLEGCA